MSAGSRLGAVSRVSTVAYPRAEAPTALAERAQGRLGVLQHP